MTIYNVRTTIVALVDAENETDAINKLHAHIDHIDRDGFVYVHIDAGAGHVPHAFKSEPLEGMEGVIF